MTEQYGQRTINQEGEYRRVTQADIDTTLVTPAVVLGPGDQYVLLDDDGSGVAYQVNLPRVADSAGLQYVLKGAPTLGAAAVTVASAEYGTPPANSDTFDAVASPAGVMGVADRFVVQADPPLAPVAPAIVGAPSNNWSLITLLGAPA